MAQFEVDRRRDEDGERGDDAAVAQVERRGVGDLGARRVAHEDRVGAGLLREAPGDLDDGRRGAALGHERVHGDDRLDPGAGNEVAQQPPVRVVDPVDEGAAVEVEDPPTRSRPHLSHRFGRPRRYRRHPEDRPAVAIFADDLDAAGHSGRRRDGPRVRHELREVTFGQVRAAIRQIAPLQAQHHGHESRRDDHVLSSRV